MESPPSSSPSAIAIIGMAGRFPGAGDIESFWENLAAGIESITFFSEQELRAAGVEAELLADPAYVRARSVVDGAEMFDAAFFDLSPREAEVIDPQHRLLLECAWEALERAGHDPRRFPGPIGVFAGTSLNTYMLSNLLHNPEVMESVGLFQTMVGSCSDFLATRISYKLGLRGPSLTVQTACSTSLVAVHLAVQSLLNSECDMALAGGVRILVPRKGGHLYQPGGIFSRDGHCRAFDAGATGTTEGEGCGLVVLKRLADALADGDHIHAVILGSAINNDGSTKLGFTVPSIEGQTEVIAMAQALAGVDPGTIGLIEAHGTGTPLGDPIEAAALSRIFSMAAAPGFRCALGSLKSNLGHLDTAAGVASLVKTTLAIEHGLIPPSLHFEQPNPQIDFASGPFYVPVQAIPWPGEGPRRAGVSSYGFGGTNAHIVLEEAPKVLPGSASRPRQLLTLSASTLSALEKVSQNLAEHLRRNPEIDLADVAYTLQMGRVPFNHRRIVVCEDVADAVDVLSTLDPKRVLSRTREAGDRAVIFLFPGQGAQYPGMGAELYGSEPVFREEVDRCAEILRPWLGLDLRQVLYPEECDPAEAAARLEQTALAQPALFVVEHALARLWMAWGIRPTAMLGHSIGEYVAACLARVFSLEGALRLVAERGRLMQEMPGGSMLAVSLPEAEVWPLLGGLSLAAINGPSMCVVSGDPGEIDDLATRLGERGVQVRRLHTSHAFHSAAMEPMLERFAAAFEGLHLNPPEIPFLSNLTGAWIRPEEATAPRYWVRHLRETVRFSDGLEALFARSSSVFLEVGPGKALTSLARQHPKRPTAPSVLASLPAVGDGRPADAAVLRVLGQLWLAGVEIDWAGFHSRERRQRVPLPTYPFERRRYWVEPAPGEVRVRQHAAEGTKEVADWFWVPLWYQELPPEKSELPDGSAAGTWLVFTDETGLGDRLVARLRERGGKVAIVRAGETFQEAGPGDFVIRPGEAADYRNLLDRLSREGMDPARIVHLWSVVGPVEGSGTIEEAEREQKRGFFSLLHLAQAFGERRPAETRPPLHLGIVSTGVHRITGAENLAPARATLLGPAITLPQEYSGVTCAAIDIALLPQGSRREKRLVDLLIAELATSAASPVVAYRGTDRWLRAFKPLSLASSRGPLPLRDAGTYLITGGLGGVGLELAGLLARSARVRLVLTSHAPFAEREEWPVLAQGEDRTARITRRLLDLETTGAKVWVAAADVTDAASMRRLFGEARRRFGRFDGVIHAAGLAGGGLVQTRSLAEAEAVLAPKVRGTLVLEELLAGDAPDFLVLCSSLNPLVGGSGQADSAAANAFLDAFAHSRAGEFPVFSINWSPWNRQTEERGNGHRSGKIPVLPRIEEMLEGMEPEQAVEAFRHILAGGHLPQIAVSVRSLPEVLEQALSMTAERRAETVSPKPGSGHARPDLETPYVAPRGEVEERLTVIWGDVLGLDRVGTADDFFELGGHSLLGTRLVSRVRETFGVEVPLGQLFEAATVADFATFVEAKLALAGASELAGIPRLPRNGELPLSFAQERLWFLDQLEPDSAFYNIPYRLWIGGPLVIPALAIALSGLMERHEALRTIFPAENGHPRQVVLSAVPLPLPLVDLQSLPLEAREETALQLAAEESQRPFDLVRGPLLRALLARVEPRRHALILPLHHIIADGWSTAVLLHDLGALYEAAVAGVPSPLPELPVQYADYAVWQRSWLQGEVLAAQLEYWKRQLAGAPAVLKLPFDRPRPAEQSYRGASRPVPLSSFLSEAIRRLCRQEGATPFMALLAAWAVLLGRHAGQDDVLVGAPIAGRSRREVEGLIGCFINTLVLRSDLSANPSFGELLGRVRRTVLDAFAHQDLPFERIVEEVVVERNLAVSPLFQVIFNLHNAPMTNLEAPGLVFSQLDVDTGIAKFDLSLILQESPGGFEGRLEHNADLFDGDTVERLLARFSALLEAAVQDSSLPVADLEILLHSERQQVLLEWSGAATLYPRQATIHALFLEQAVLWPDAVAVIGGGKSLSYRELERRAGLWARRLRDQGVGPEVRVGICLDRSQARVVIILAVLMAGGAYVPLDPAYPQERLAFLIGDSGTSVLVTEERWLPSLPRTGAVVLCLDDGGPWEGAPVEARELPQVLAEGLAYVMYTSGSTGEPKGVSVTHRSVVRLVRETGYARFGRDEVFLQLAPYSFDASTLELWGALLNGGCLVMPPAGVLSAAELGEILTRYGVTTLWLTAGLFHQVVDENPRSLTGVRQLLAGGDVLSVPHVRRVLEELPGTRLINGYGPTENTTFTCCYPVTASEALVPSVPLGRPIANTWVYLLDRNLAPVPIGVTGELYAGGDGLARGYLARPERTAERFVPDPFAGEPGERLYRTGDLARWRPGGEIEFLGRIDQQVKIRGFRVEPGEIEAALGEHPAVREAAVVVDGAGEMRRLVAYCSRQEAEAGAAELRRFLLQRLPEHLVPSAFVFLPELPLTANGKVDRKALVQLRPEPAAATAGAGPRTPTEELLAGIFAEALEVERIGVHESFFERGGHSLLATRVVSRVREAFRVELPLRELFEAPSVAELAERVQQATQSAEGTFLPPIEPMPRDGGLPLSFAQERLWFIDQLEPGSSAYNVPVALRVRGSFNVKVMQAALDEVARRHEALRTTFARVEERPIQVVAAPAPVHLAQVDLTGLPGSRRWPRALQWAQEEGRRAFDLIRGPLLRCLLVRLEEREHLLLLNMHHIVSDGWSMGVLLRELTSLYDSFLKGRPSPLAELPIQYADFASWQRQWLRGEVLEEELGYWRERLSGVPAVLELPADRPRPATQTFAGASFAFALPRELSVRLLALSRRLGATLFMTLLSAFQELLSRYSGQPDLTVGTPVAGRTQLQTEDLIGFFVNMLVARTDLSDEPSFAALVGRVRETLLSAYAHQDLPFESLVEELQPDRSLSHAPLYQVVFALQNMPIQTLEIAELSFEPVTIETGTAKFDLTVSVQETETGLSAVAEYNIDLFDATTVRRLVRHWEVLLAGVASAPECRLSELEWVTPEERMQLLREWNDTSRPCAQRPMVHELFARHAALRPEATAVASAEGRLSYGEVERRANRLAWHLRGLGIGPDVLVAICTERTLLRVVGIVAVLKAGGAYVSLDPSYPEERMAFLLEDSRAPVLLTEARFAGGLPRSRVRVLCLDADWESIQGEESMAPASGVELKHLAYVAYTSGSTGRPKGVEIPHAGLSNLAQWHRDLYSVQPEDRGTQIASPAFDASVWELWPYLAAGASVHIPDEEARLSPTGMIRWWTEQGITLAFLMTPLAEGVLEERLTADLRVRALIIGGDRLHRGPDTEMPFPLMNNYGPAEYSVVSTVGKVPPRGGLKGLPTIGRAIDNTRTYVLDPWLHPVPVGVPGELWMAGVGVARGYRERPDLTAEKFMPDPFSEEPGARMYRTADQVRYVPEGEIDFLGRLDHQVKIRGLRIELGEIEAVLRQHPDLCDVAATVREDRPGNKRLVAYVVAVEDRRPGAEELRSFLGERLPEYMVPSAFVELGSLPLTPNGKVDRRALPAPELPTASSTAPRTLPEEVLAGIFAEVLGLERVGVEDDFFSLGGHSLMATRLVSRLREVFGQELPLRLIFEAPTVAELAERIGSLREGPPAPPVRPVPRDRELPLSFAQQRLWLIDQIEPDSPEYNIPLALRLTGEIEPRLLDRIFSEIGRRHEALRTTFASREGGPVQVIASPGLVELPLIDLSSLPGKEREAQARDLAISEARCPFNLQRGPLLRLLLVRLATTDHLLLLTLHHVVSDGWSMGVLLREITALYEAFSMGLPSPLAELPVQYADFAVWQRSWLQGETLDAQLDHWKRRLAGVSAVLELPLDRPRPAVQTSRGATRPLHLGPALSDAVGELCRREGATPFMALLAAWALLLGRHAGQDDVLIGVPIAGRNRREIEGLIGFFVNTLVLRSDLSGNPTFAELLGRVRQTALDAFTHQDLPFERLVEELAPERSLAHTPLFQVLFMLQNAPLGNLTVPGLALSPVNVDTGIAKFDLSLFLTDAGDGLSGALEFATDLFDAATVDRLWNHFRTLLESALADPRRHRAELTLLPAGELHQVLREWNDVPGGDGSACVHHLVETQARRTPDAAAVLTQDGKEISYRELDRLAEGLALRLRGLGVRPDDRVGVCLERSWEGVVTLLAVLKAGGCYLPLDPAYPPERLRFMLSDSAAPVIVTRDGLAAALPSQGVRVLSLDAFRDGGWPEEGRGADLPAVGLDHLSYVIYTSGSTGRPKGVALPHRTLANLVAWQIAASAAPAGRTLQFASPSFDVSLQETLATWAAGGTLVLLSEDERGDAEAVLRRLRAARVERLFLPFVALQQLAEAASRADGLPPLREVVTAGEQLQVTPEVRALFSRLPGCVLRNQYGPSETHVVTEASLWNERCGEVEEWPALPSIGRPVAGTEVHLLDSQGAPVPIGIPGEIWLGGMGLARGYLDRPDLTAARFVPDPWGRGGRLYRTGDLARRRPSGEIEFLGRIDHQVKIRGFRIELGEIEAALAAHPAVREAVVVVRGEGAAKRLVACVVPAEGLSQTADALRAHLRDRLPDYMVPGAFVAVESFPLTASGKVDRRALALSPEPRQAVSAGASPRTPVEELLAGIWGEVLGIERVEVDESFFALGGHSLLATQVMSRIRGVFGTDLPVRQLFESPTIAELARAVQQAGSTVQAPPILPVPRNGASTVSFAQQRLWLLDQLEPGNPAYNLPLALRLNGEIEPGLLARIFSEIVRRHEALRTTFAPRDDGPVQVIASPAPLALPLLDLSHLHADEREAQARALALSEARRPFDLQRGPLLRLLLMRLAGTDWLLLLNMHHIVSDGWSLGVLVREVTALVEAFAQGLPSPLPELPVQYADFAVWQRSWLQGEVLDAQLGHWKRRLAGAPAVLELPLDRQRPAVQSYRGARCPVVLSSPLSEAIGCLCRQQGITPFMALLAGWAVLLGRHAGQDDVLVGAPIAGRNRREIEGLIGFFLNTLVLRADLSGNPSLAELLGQVRRTALDAFAHQDLPFERLVEELAPERSLAHTPLFQVMLVLQNAPMGDLTVPGLALSPVDVDASVAKFDLSLTLFESPDGFTGVLTYAADLFDPSTAERLVAGFQTLLSGMATAGPDVPLHDLEVLSETDRRQLLVDWSAEDERVSALSLHGLVERQAERTPDAVAVIFEEERWSYRDLVRRSREIAASLRAQGVGPGDRVAILDRRSAERVARVLGVLAAGATYVAIDTEQPQAWRARILADLAPVRILPPQGTTLHDPEPSSRGSETRLPAIGGELPGYVVYTSGSTGRPKGIVAHHRGAATYLEWVVRNYGLAESDVALQLAPLTFDASLRDTLAPLAAGGRIVIVPDGVARDPSALLERMEAHGVTCLPSIVPSLLRLLVEEMPASGRKVPSLRLILASGEKLHGADAAAVRRAFGEKVSLINQYGPSEATMTSTWYPVTAADESLPALPVGRPAASARVFLLDRVLRPVPPGAVGEICLGGPGLAFGYLGQPDRTAEVFIPDPFGTPGDRLYRTGDRGRYSPDGVLELLGRIDLQVKIRGQRVEPGEVEAVLRSHPAVREAVVAAFGEDEPRLAAWLVAEGTGAGDLRAFLAERLPASMVPADWAFLDALPLTPHGKVDRARLPEPGRRRRAVQEPRDRTELRLVRLWEEVLGSQSVGISDNFFTLGGHSLSAVRLMAGVRRLFGRELPLSELFRRPTIEALAELLRRGDRDLSWSPLVALTAGCAEKAPLFCVHGADGHVLTFADLARTLSAAGDDRPVFALEARGLSDGQAPLRSIEDMAALYLSAIREVRPRGAYRLLGYSMGSKIAFAMARQLERDGEAVEQLVLVDIPAHPSAAANPDLEIPEEIRALPDFDPELADRHVAVWTANQEASRRWRPAPYKGKALLIVAEDGVCAGAADPALGWGAVAEGGVEVVSTPGDHFSLFRPQHVQALALKLT